MYTLAIFLLFLPAVLSIDYVDQQRRPGQQAAQPFPSSYLQSPNNANPRLPQQQQSPFGSVGIVNNQYQPAGQQAGQQGRAGGLQPGQLPPYQQQFGNPQQKQQQQSLANQFGAIGSGLGQTGQQALDFGRGLQRNLSNIIGNPFGISGGNPNPNGHSVDGNVLVEVQLRSYANPSFRLPGNQLCTCPQGDMNCLFASPQRNGWNCLTSISVFVLSAEADLKFNETIYQPLNQYGQYPFDQSPQPTFQFTLDSQPTAIALLVHNLGARIAPDGHLIETNAVTVVDYLVYNITAAQPAPGGYGGSASGQGVSLQGKLQGTELSFSYSISCRGERGIDGKALVGPGCDLSCNSSSLTGNTAICMNQKTGFYSICRWTGGGNSQVTNCQNCPWGIKEGAYCADEQGGVLQPDHAGVVSSFYYKAFIFLAILCALLLICFVLLCLISLRSTLKNRRGTAAGNRGSRSGRNNEAAATAAGFNTAPRVHRGDPEAAALNSSIYEPQKPPPPYAYQSNGGGVHAVVAAGGPLALARSNASTASVAGSEHGTGGGSTSGRAERRFPPMVVSSKSGKTLSPPRYQPLPHLGINAGTDSLNSSFAGSHVMPLPPPSVSADV